MAEKGTTPDPAEGASRRKRQAPTIDLTATDVSPQSTSAAQDQAAAEPSPQAESAEEHSGAGGTDAPSAAAPANWTAPRPLLLGGFGGALLVAAALLVAWFAGLVPSRYAETGGADPAAVAALRTRLAKLEAAVADAPVSDKTVPERLAATDNAMKSLGIALTALNKRNDEVAATAADARAHADESEKTVAELRNTVQNLTRNTSAGLSPADFDSVQKRLATLEETAKAAPIDRPARLAVVAVSLRDTAARGAPFAAELNEAKSLGADEKLTTALAPFAANGVPGSAAMLNELNTLLAAMVKRSGAPAPAGGFLARMQANAEKLVRIRPVNAPAGDDASAVLVRLEIDVAHADINGALADLGKLDAKIRAPAQDWISRAQARQAALAAADQLVAASALSLDKR